MKKHQKRQRLIATFFLLIFFPTLVPTSLFASNNGPNSLEVANFEPTDATDMVNLATGDLSYVLPLLNVPSPEGGYPISLAYHAGIAIDQEASWTGLGWSLNPGAINRNVNGYPDDVEGGVERSFIYDVGGDLSVYNIGVGANLFGINAGVGAYWGSNKAFGGSVSFGYGPISTSLSTGSYGTSGSIGVGYSFSGTPEMQISNFSSGNTLKTLKKQSKSLPSGGGVTMNSQSYSKNDYNINEVSKGINLSYLNLNFYFGQTKINYSLFLEKNYGYNGILYPTFFTNNPRKSMTSDVDKLQMYNSTTSNILDVYDGNRNINLDNSLMSNYDNYSVNAQGISGSISPVSIYERELAMLNYGTSPYYINYFNGDVNTYNQLNENIYFEFENTTSSFLRIDRSNVIRDLQAETSDQMMIGNSNLSYKSLCYAKTNNSNLFNENTSPDGILLKANNRKRTGKYIETFTNQQIVSNSINGFIEAKNLNRNQPNIYKNKAIGGYRVTDIDGKVYHYSLPVINFEIWHKNCNDLNNENSNFALTEKKEPYATDWLLTAVTGSDYVDINNNNQIDNEDYGYWVEFDYGKWSDGYIWKSDPEIIKGDIVSGDRIEYYRGRKQIYYLDAIRTRTHTAYFVKSLRKDALSQKMDFYDSNNSPLVYESPSQEYNLSGQTVYGYPNLDRGFYNIPATYNGSSVTYVTGTKNSIFYAKFPVQKSLKLDKIVLVNNKNNIYVSKSSGNNLLPPSTGDLYENSAFTVTNAILRSGNNSNYSYSINGSYYNSNNFNHTIVDLHQSQNVLDVNDISGTSLVSNSEKIVSFEHDSNYSLSPNSNYSEADNKGKLTLLAIDFLGKGGSSVLPKYKFSYNSGNTNPSISNLSREDGWGYDKTNPSEWSLREIITPVGSKIKIDYESDDYSQSFSNQARIFNKGLTFKLTKNTSTNKLIFEVRKNTDPSDNVIDEFTNFLDFFTYEEPVVIDFYACRRSKYGGHRREARISLDVLKAQVGYVDDNVVIFELEDNHGLYWNFDDQDEWWILNRTYSNNGVKHLNGNNDNVIMRQPGYRTCYEWRDSYSNDDVTFHYRLVSPRMPKKGKGGGLRVKQINVVDNNNTIGNKVKYFYNKKGTAKNSSDASYVSSGVLPFVPTKQFTIIPYASQLPAPVVVYNNVSMEEYTNNDELISRVDYEFETISNNSNSPSTIYTVGDKLKVEKVQSENPIPNLYFSKYKIKDRISNIGRLKSIKSYNSNNQLINSTNNNYYNYVDSNYELGVKQESYLSKYVYGNDYKVNSIDKTQYPNLLADSETTSNGNKVKVIYNKYDFLTGDVIESTTETSYGTSVKMKTAPAYFLKYPEMGSKVDNINNKNMLTQTAMETSYILDGGTYKETGVGITTWNNIWSYKDIGGNTSSPTNSKEKVWRKHKSYIWNGVVDSNGIFLPTNYNSATDDGFVWGVGLPQTNPEWKQISEVRLYDHYSAPLEMRDINNNFISTKMGDNDTKVMANGNAGYNEMYYSGAENILHNFWLEPEVRLVSGSRSNQLFHTGKYSVATTSSSQLGIFMRNGEHKAGKYKLTVWVHKNNANNARLRVWDNSNLLSFSNESYTAGDWILKTAYLDITTGDFYPFLNSADGTTVYYDDLMIRPIASSISGYVYNEWDELTYIIGNNGLATKFEYDAAGKLVKTYTEVIDDSSNNLVGGFKLTQQNKINYKHLK